MGRNIVDQEHAVCVHRKTYSRHVWHQRDERHNLQNLVQFLASLNLDVIANLISHVSRGIHSNSKNIKAKEEKRVIVALLKYFYYKSMVVLVTLPIPVPAPIPIRQHERPL